MQRASVGTRKKAPHNVLPLQLVRLTAYHTILCLETSHTHPSVRWGCFVHAQWFMTR